MKRLFALALVFTLVFACLPLSAGSAEAEKVKISFLSWQNETTMMPVLEPYLAANPNVELDFQYAPPVQDYVEKFRMLVTAGELPDMFVSCAENKLEVYTNGLAVRLNEMPIMERLGQANKDAYTDANGNIIAFTPDAWIAAIFYNEDLLKQAGCEVPTNRDEYLNSMKALQNAGIAPWVFNANNLYDPLQGYVATETIAHDRSYDKKVDAGELTYTEGWTTPVQLWYDEYVATGYMQEEALGLNGDQAMDMFILGEACYTIGATWSVGTIDEKNPDLNYGMLPFFPTNTDEPGWCVGAAGVGWSVNSKSNNIDACMDLMNYLGSTEAMTLFQQQTRGLLAISGIEYDIHPVIAQQINCLLEGRFYLPAVEWRYSDALGKEMLVGTQNVLAGVIEPQEIVNMLNTKWAELNAAEKE